MLMVAVAFASAASAADLPKGFVYLSSVDPTIVQDMRYAAADNFTRKIVPGYHAAECVLTVEAAKALAKVQADLRAGGYGVMVYDCYRPAKAEALPRMGISGWSAGCGSQSACGAKSADRGRLYR